VRIFYQKNGVIDLNICEVGLVLTLEAQNFCQERIAQIDRWIGIQESKKSRAWAMAALEKAKKQNLKTAKEREWFAQGDEDYLTVCQELSNSKAARKFFENKSGYFSGWHYAFKTFLKRDYSLERLAKISGTEYNNKKSGSSLEDSTVEDWGDDNDIEWK